MTMTRDDIITYGKKKYGEHWISLMASDLDYNVSSVMRLANGETPEVSPRMELAMEKLMRKHRFETLARPDVRYE